MTGGPHWAGGYSRAMSKLLQAVSLVALSACSGRADGPSGSPQQVVEAVFAAVESHDCGALDEAIAGAFGDRVRSAGCDTTIEEFREHDFRLISVVSDIPDGRDERARLVRVRVMKTGKEKEMTVRVEPVQGKWKVTTL